MLKVIITYYEDCATIETQGHANYAKKGQDIVCAGVSTIYQALIATAESKKIGSAREHVQPNGEINYLHIHYLKSDCLRLVQMFQTGVEMISYQYPTNVNLEVRNAHV